MNKIKSIEVRDFRVYEGTARFEFCDSKGIANLVAIYAPNGFGKTSFFDAIEWAYSDKINRLEQSVLKNEVKGDDFSINDKIVLTNRNSYRKNKKSRGKVTIDTENGPLIKEVSVRKRNNVDTKDDYRAGTISGFYTKEQIKDLPSTNILTHDQIDRFLRQETPEQKFAVLQDFWPEGKRTFKKYKDIKVLLSQVEGRSREISAEIDSLQSQIDELSMSHDSSIRIGQLIELINSRDYLASKFEFSDKRLGKKQYDTLLFNSSLNKKKIIEAIEESKRRSNQLVWLKGNFEVYNKKTIEISTLVKDIDLLKNRLILFRNFNQLNSDITAVNNNINDLKKKHDEFQIVFKDIDDILKSKKDIENINATINKSYKKISSININLSSYNKWIDKLSRFVIECNESLSKFRKDRDIIEQNYLEFLQRKSQKENINNNIEKSDLERKGILSKIKELEYLKVTFNSICSHKQWEHDILSDDPIFQTSRCQLVELNITLNDLCTELEKKNIEFNTAGELSENLEKIKVWGEKYVASTRQDDCPLCNSKFSNFEELLARVTQNKDDALNITEKKLIIEKIKLELDTIKNDINDLENSLVSMIQEKIESVNYELDVYNKKLVPLNNDRVELESQISLFTLIINEKASFFRFYDLDENDINEHTVSILNSRIVKQIDSNISKVERVEKILHNLREKSDYKHEFKAKYDSLISSSESQKDIITFNDSQKLSLNLANKHHLNIVEDSKVSLKSNINSLSKEIAEKIKEKDTLTEKITLVNDRLESDESNLSESSILDTLIDKEALRSKSDKYIFDYLERYQRCNLEDDPEEALISQYIEKEGEIKEYLEGNINQLDLFETHVERAINQNLRSEYINKQEALRERLEPVETAKVRLNKLIASCMTYMQEGIDSYFNKEVINKIYQRIEPHPSLTEINFIAEIGDKGPRLLISAKGDNEEVNPAIYLSAGQVNVLSLSIFLAKAFVHGGNSISTIFMDDPVHNLSDINILSFIDLLRSLTSTHKKQIVLSTHDEKFFKLMQNKIPEKYNKSKYIELAGEGMIKPIAPVC